MRQGLDHTALDGVCMPTNADAEGILPFMGHA
jgi:hypothetical protein